MDYIVLAFALGYISYPFINAIRAVFINAYNATYPSKCTGNCRQGRDCDCRDKT